MSSVSRILCILALAFGATPAFAANAPKESPFGQAGTAPAATGSDTLEFAGVSKVGKKVMVNLYDKRDKRSFWVEAGKTASGVTVVKYDDAHDQVTVRRNGVEQTLGLRAGRVANAPAVQAPLPVSAEAATLPAPAPTPSPAPTQPLSQARQEEEARMLVSDLLEIGMAQRRAYEEAQRKAASGQSTQSGTPDPSAPAGTVTQSGTHTNPRQPAQTPQPGTTPTR